MINLKPITNGFSSIPQSDPLLKMKLEQTQEALDAANAEKEKLKEVTDILI